MEKALKTENVHDQKPNTDKESFTLYFEDKK